MKTRTYQHRTAGHNLDNPVVGAPYSWTQPGLPILPLLYLQNYYDEILSSSPEPSHFKPTVCTLSVWHRFGIGHGLYFVSLESVWHRSRSLLCQLFGVIGFASVLRRFWRRSWPLLLYVGTVDRVLIGTQLQRGQPCSHVSNMYVNTNRWSMYVFIAFLSVLYNSHPSS